VRQLQHLHRAPPYQPHDATAKATREHTGEECVVRRAHGTAAREGLHLAHLGLDRLGSVAARKSVRNTSDLATRQEGPHFHTEEVEARSRRTTPAVRDALERNLPGKAARAVAVVEQAAGRLVQAGEHNPRLFSRTIFVFLKKYFRPVYTFRAAV